VSSNLQIGVAVGAVPIDKPHHGGGYHASAVHFDGTVHLSTNSLTSTDNTDWGAVFWYHVSSSEPSPGHVLYVADPTNGYDCFEVMGPDAPNGVYNDFGIGDNGGNNSIDYSHSNTMAFAADVWHCIILAGDSSAGVMKVYDGDNELTGNTTTTFGTVPFTIATNGLAFFIGGDPIHNLVGDVADLRIMPGTSLLTAGDISQTTRRLFVDSGGKPVDPSVATAALGAPCMLFSGNRTTFPVNQGTGGAFTLTGTLTNASSSPSD
jgi:hypothetical protein